VTSLEKQVLSKRNDSHMCAKLFQEIDGCSLEATVNDSAGRQLMDSKILCDRRVMS
jgi:hypothetical protein